MLLLCRAAVGRCLDLEKRYQFVIELSDKKLSHA